ncbi:hypothetical protein ACH5RR_030623 [Cinchona calisaya]|uniref:Uncharacterized protein n=1 Tax=Cinchona calisaya TaxID=153742 RepID=A0ABD2YYD2_9GENT
MDSTCSEVISGDGCTSLTNKGFMLFGVRVVMEEKEEGSLFRKSASMNNLSQFQQPHDAMNNEDDVNAGYVSDDVVHPSARNRHRKRGVPWSEEEHRLFLLGLQKVGKGDWRGISRNFVKTRTPTQVASHAQKYFLRRNNHSRRRRRSSLFDITTETVLDSAMEDRILQESMPQPEIMQHQKNLINNLENFPMSSFSLSTNISSTPKHIRPIPVVPIPPSSKLAGDLNLNKTTIPHDPLPLSLKLSTPSEQQPSPAPARHASPFQAMSSSFDNNSGDGIISVA